MNILAVGVQSNGIVNDNDPLEGFEMMKRAGFSCCDFSLDTYCSLENNDFFQQSVRDLKNFFAPHKDAAEIAGIKINQMRMPHPACIPNATAEKNDYWMQTVASKCMEVCAFFGCPYIVIYGFNTAKGSSVGKSGWEQMEKFLKLLLPMAKELKITICMKNTYTCLGNYVLESLSSNVEKAVFCMDYLNKKYGAEVLGVCFDTGYARLLGIDFEDFITILGSHLKVLHIHDNDGSRDLHQIPFTFNGCCENYSCVDWDGFIRGLCKIRFDKVLSFETASALSAFPGKMKQDVLRFVAQIGSYFAEEIQTISEQI